MDYVEAKLIYNEYMEKLYDKYGGEELFRLYEKAGSVEEFVPCEPKIKPTKLNKEFKKRGIIISPRSKDKENFVVPKVEEKELLCIRRGVIND